MNLDDLTLGQIKQLQSVVGSKKEPICDVGKNYFIRSVTHHYLGRCTKVTDDWIELDEAAWIADDGRFHDFLKKGIANEVEPFVNPVRVPVGCINDVTEWEHALLKEQK